MRKYLLILLICLFPITVSAGGYEAVNGAEVNAGGGSSDAETLDGYDWDGVPDTIATAGDLTFVFGADSTFTLQSASGLIPFTVTAGASGAYSMSVMGPAHYTGTVTTTGNIISGGNFSKVGSGTFLSGYSNNFNVGISGGGQTTMTSFNTNSFVFQARGYDFLDDYTGTAGLMYIQGPVSIGAGIAYTIATAIANYTLTEEVIILLCGTGGADYTVTTNAAADLVGHIFKIKRTGTDKVFFDPNGAETVDGVLDIALDTLNDWIEVTTDGFTWFIIGRNS